MSEDDRRAAREARIARLERQIADLRTRLPRHSVPAAMMVQLEDLEEELAQLRAQAAGVEPGSDTPRI